MAKNIHGTRSDLIHCDNCGEDYSSTYKRCPFCGTRPVNTQSGGGRLAGGRAGQDYGRSRQPQPEEEDDYIFDGQDVFDDLDRERGRGSSLFQGGGGRHLSGGGLGISPTTLIGFIVSGVIVLAAILIVILVVIPMIRGGKTPAASNSPNGSLPGTSASQTISPSPLPITPNPSGSPDPSLDPGTPTDSPLPSEPASPSPGTVTSVPPANGNLTLVAYNNVRTEISISDAYPNPVQFEVRGASGAVTWKSSNTAVVSVTAAGVVSGVGRGEATVTATDAAGNSGSCRVLVSLSNPSGATSSAPATSTAPTSPAPSASQAPSTGGSLTLTYMGSAREDITMSSAYPDPVRLQVSGASGAVTWSSSNTAVATVDANGTVTMAGKGQCTITATDASGKSGTCLVRVN